MLRQFLISAGLLLALLPAAVPDPVNPDPNSPRPIDAVDSVFIEDLTWMEVRDALRAGKDTVLVATGGVEQNGPYLVTGKHNVVLRGTTTAIARKLGNALVAPIVPFVPEGDIDPPTSMMKYPGSISVSEATFQSLLTDICASLRAHGFKNIILIGDSGGNQDGMKAVAAALSAKWTDGKTRIRYIPEYFNYADVQKFAKVQGINQVEEGYHDDYPMTAVMMSVDPDSVRTKQRIKADKFKINGIELAPQENTIAFGRKVIDFRADVTVKAIRAALAQ
jgi:creatinine amidohydrolase